MMAHGVGAPVKRKEHQMQNRIFSMDNPKAIKANDYGYLNAIHYMAPAALAGVGDLCPNRSEGCTALCLGWFSGQASMVKSELVRDRNSVRLSRIAKAKRFMRNRQAYMRDVIRSIELAQHKAQREGFKLCVRMNGSTDIGWEGIRDSEGVTLMQRFPNVQFTDYTKSPKRALAHAMGKFPANYSLCFSRSETNETQCLEVLRAGGTVAVVFACDKPTTYLGYPVVDGDMHDLRFLDSKGHVVALTPKGPKAKKDKSGFVVRALPCPHSTPQCEPMDLGFSRQLAA
jgi:hypothetical protein